MMDLLNLPVDTIRSICGEWMTISDVCRLDSAFCSHQHRMSFIETLQSAGAPISLDIERLDLIKKDQFELYGVEEDLVLKDGILAKEKYLKQLKFAIINRGFRIASLNLRADIFTKFLTLLGSIENIAESIKSITLYDVRTVTLEQRAFFHSAAANHLEQLSLTYRGTIDEPALYSVAESLRTEFSQTVAKFTLNVELITSQIDLFLQQSTFHPFDELILHPLVCNSIPSCAQNGAPMQLFTDHDRLINDPVATGLSLLKQVKLIWTKVHYADVPERKSILAFIQVIILHVSKLHVNNLHINSEAARLVLTAAIVGNKLTVDKCEMYFDNEWIGHFGNFLAVAKVRSLVSHNASCAHTPLLVDKIVTAATGKGCFLQSLDLSLKAKQWCIFVIALETIGRKLKILHLKIDKAYDSPSFADEELTKQFLDSSFFSFFPRLRSVKIHGLWLSIGDLSREFRACPMLEKFVIDASSLDDEYEMIDKFPVQLFQLPRLTHCHLHHGSVTPNFVEQVLRSVKFHGRGKRMLIELQVGEGELLNAEWNEVLRLRAEMKLEDVILLKELGE